MADRREDRREVERALLRIAPQLDVPETPDLTSSVRVAIAAGRPAPWWSRSWLRRPRPVFALAVVGALVVVLSASPASREAVARWLGIRGARIEIEPGLRAKPSAVPTSLTRLGPGYATTLAEAESAAGFELAPPPAALGEPDAVYVDRSVAGSRVSYVYEPRPGLPPTKETGVGLLFTQFQAPLNQDAFGKTVHAGASVRAIEVEGAPGFWIEGSHLFYFFEDRDGELHEEARRLAGNALIWEQGDVTMRIEARLSHREALALARSIE